ncbi:hypothetical protein CJP74_01795 [Psittacicella melopsittaci]|uniref:Uncharacterized protein n=1 Tax=Psittacicella melopsittaci TaxID=2028576 RepID=A0A3A1Y5F4_9GAMM|nr:hypothetical protein [Psittacicella melopsittaci]RIY33483.1 hypothetical protein CJP74_01795 [Psittacicella melopsittaci]
MFRKALLTLGIALASCNVFATDYSNYSYTQLKQEHSRLEKATLSDLTFFLKLTSLVKEEYGGKSMTPYDLLKIIHGPYFYYVNKDFKVVGNNYYHDPKVTNLVNLHEVCYQLWQHTKEIDEICQAITFLAIYSGGDINSLQTLAILAPGTFISKYPNHEVTAQHTLLVHLSKNLDNYNYSFKLYLPTQNELLNNKNFVETVSSFLKVNLIAPK